MTGWLPGAAVACQAVPVQQDLLSAHLALVVRGHHVVVAGSVDLLVSGNIQVVFLLSVSPK